jgi:transposase-like protein
MTKYQKVSLTLPEETSNALQKADTNPDRNELKSYIVALRQEGWTLESIARPLGVSREWIRQMEADYADIEAATSFARSMGFTIPERPIIEKPPRAAKPQPDPEVLARLKELKSKAQLVRSSSPRYRAEAEEYTRLIFEENNTRGVPIARLARELGVSHGALRFRLVRYGYKQSASESKVYQPIRDKNRLV